MYNVAHSLQTRHDPGAYVKTCLAKSPSVFSLYSELASYVISVAPDTKKMLSKRKRPRAKKDSYVAEQLDHDMIEKVDSEVENEDWDENNRFALLKVN